MIKKYLRLTKHVSDAVLFIVLMIVTVIIATLVIAVQQSPLDISSRGSAAVQSAVR